MCAGRSFRPKEVMMSSPLEQLEPKLIWKHFDAIRQTPRPSKHEEKIIALIQAWAAERSFKVLQDEVGTLCVKVPATPGHESAPTVVLQGHMDMVCEKNADVDFDFMNDAIRVKVEGDWVVTEGTTLGADNGIGLAAAMAVADDPDVVHGPLELLCTVDEETGLTGAMNLDPEMLEGRIMLNLDTEEDGAVYIGCAGGVDTSAVLSLDRRRGLLDSVPVRLVIRGLKGGHSGLNIIENRGNAIKLANRVLLAALEENPDIDIIAFEGGSKHNAIPREAFVSLRILDGDLDELREIAEKCLADFRIEFGAIEPDLEVVIEELEDAPEYELVLDTMDRDIVVTLIDALPHGVLSMSRDVPGLVETSTNLAVINIGDDDLRLVTSHRSSVMPALFALRDQVSSILHLVGADIEVKDGYPGWQPNPDSPIVRKTVEVFEKLFDKTPEIKAIHAGLECGLLIEKVPDMDCVSIGPQIEGAHSPDEKLQISSVRRFYQHLAAILQDLA